MILNLSANLLTAEHLPANKQKVLMSKILYQNQRETCRHLNKNKLIKICFIKITIIKGLNRAVNKYKIK